MSGWTFRCVAPAVALLALAIALPGCLSQDATPDAHHAPEVTRDPSPQSTLTNGPGGAEAGGEDAYWFVHVTGGEGPYGVACDRGFSYEVDAAQRSLAYSPEAHAIDPANVSALVAYSVDRGSCPLAYGLEGDGGSTPWDLGVLGMLAITLSADGAAVVMLDGSQSTVPVGMQLRITGEGHVQHYGEGWDVTSAVVVTNHGAWPRSGLQGAADGAGW